MPSAKTLRLVFEDITQERQDALKLCRHYRIHPLDIIKHKSYDPVAISRGEVFFKKEHGILWVFRLPPGSKPKVRPNPPGRRKKVRTIE